MPSSSGWRFPRFYRNRSGRLRQGKPAHRNTMWALNVMVTAFSLYYLAVAFFAFYISFQASMLSAVFQAQHLNLRTACTWWSLLGLALLIIGLVGGVGQWKETSLAIGLASLGLAGVLVGVAGCTIYYAASLRQDSFTSPYYWNNTFPDVDREEMALLPVLTLMPRGLALTGMLSVSLAVGLILSLALYGVKKTVHWEKKNPDVADAEEAVDLGGGSERVVKRIEEVVVLGPPIPA